MPGPSALDPRLDRHEGAAAAQRALARFEHRHHAQSAGGVGFGRAAPDDAVDEMLALHFERFALLDARDVDVAIAVGHLEVAVGVVIRTDRHPLVVDADLFLQSGVVVDQHLARSHNGGAPDFVGIQPAYVDEGDQVVGEAQGEHRHVFHVMAVMALAMAAHFVRHLPQQHQDYRDVVSGQVPGDVDVALEQTQVGAHGADVEDVAQLAAANDLADFQDRCAVLEGVADHQRDAALARHGAQPMGRGRRSGKRLFDQGGFARRQAAAGDIEMRADGSRHDYRLDSGIAQYVVEFGGGFDGGVEILDVCQTLMAEVAADHPPGALHLVEIAGPIRAPVAQSDHRHSAQGPAPCGGSVRTVLRCLTNCYRL